MSHAPGIEEPPMENNANGAHFGLGLDVVRKTPEGTFFSKNGGKPGVHAQIEHLPNGVDFCLFMNGGAALNGETNPMPLARIVRVLNQKVLWPQENLFCRRQ